MPRLLFIVARQNSRLYEYLKRQLSGQNGVQVILERRSGRDRRQRVSAPTQQLRKGHRRRQHVRQDDLSAYGLAVIHKE